MIKKLILLLLVVCGGVMTAQATRVYVRIADGVPNNKLYTWDSGNYAYTSSWNECTLNSIGSGWYYIDTWKPFESDIKWILFNGSNDSERLSGEAEFIDVKGKYLNVTSSTQATWDVLNYVAYSPTSQTILASLTSADGVNYSGVINNQANYSKTLDMLICPEFLIEFGYGGTSKLWEQSFRPWDNYSGDNYSSFTNVNGTMGIFGGDNNWMYSSPFFYTISINIGTNHDGNNASFTVSPYFTRTINGAESNGKYYATFSSDYDVAVPTGITAYYGEIIDKSKVIMKSFGEGVGIASTDAAFLEVNSASDTYTFTPATSTRSGSNLMKKPDDGVTPAGAYVFANKSAGVGFYKTTTALNNQQGKAYLEIESGAPSFSIEIEGETTGIKVINFNEDNNLNNGQMFDLQGRRIADPTKGVYIVNGKKVIIK